MLICLVLGHKWRGVGWTSERVDRACLGLLFRCGRCGKRVCVMEPTAHVNARYEDDRIAYPQPNGEFSTLVRIGTG